MPSTFKELYREAESNDAYWVENAIISFTEGVAGLMEDQKVSRAELARRIGTSPSYVTKVLRGNVNFTLATMIKVVRALGASLDPRVVAPGPLETGWSIPSGSTSSQASTNGSWIEVGVRDTVETKAA